MAQITVLNSLIGVGIAIAIGIVPTSGRSNLALLALQLASLFRQSLSRYVATDRRLGFGPPNAL